MSSKSSPPITSWPDWPPQAIRFAHSTLKKGPRDAWSVEDWKAYALQLEAAGRELSKRAEIAEMELLASRIKLARGADKAALTAWQDILRRRGLISQRRWQSLHRGPESSLRHPGRPVQTEAWSRAAAAYSLRIEMESQRQRKVANLEALCEWYARAGLAQAKARTDASALNRMRRLHSAQNKRT